MTQTRIQGKFYPLTASIAEALRKAKLSATEWRIWSYLVELDPWGDRYEDFDYLSVMSICECSKSSFYRAIAKFQELKIFDFQSRGLSLRNLTGASHIRKPEPEADPPKSNSQPKTKPKPKTSDRPKTSEPPILRKKTSEPPQPPLTNNHPVISDPWDDLPEISERPVVNERQNTPVPDLGIQSQIWESSLKIGNPVSDLGNESQIWENEGLNPMSALASLLPQNLQISLDPSDQPDGGEVLINDEEEEVNQSKQIESQGEKTLNKKVKANETTLDATEKKDLPRDVVQEKSKERQRTASKRLTKDDIPLDLVEQLEVLQIPLDEIVLSAIASHHISQAYGAAAHVERTWETINNPRAVFLYQIPKQKAERLGQQIPEIGPMMREQYAAIEEEMATDEYKEVSQAAFAQIRKLFGKKERE